MRHTATDEELKDSYDFRLKDKLGVKMNYAVLKKSGSNWNQEHLTALRVRLVDTLPWDRFFEGWLPAEDDPGKLMLSVFLCCSGSTYLPRLQSIRNSDSIFWRSRTINSSPLIRKRWMPLQTTDSATYFRALRQQLQPDHPRCRALRSGRIGGPRRAQPVRLLMRVTLKKSSDKSYRG